MWNWTRDSVTGVRGVRQQCKPVCQHDTKTTDSKLLMEGAVLGFDPNQVAATLNLKCKMSPFRWPNKGKDGLVHNLLWLGALYGADREKSGGRRLYNKVSNKQIMPRFFKVRN